MKRLRPVIMEDCLFEHGAVSLATGAIHTVKPLEVKIPKGRLTVVTGVSGSGKSTLVRDIFFRALKRELDECSDRPGEFSSIGGSLRDLRNVDL